LALIWPRALMRIEVSRTRETLRMTEGAGRQASSRITPALSERVDLFSPPLTGRITWRTQVQCPACRSRRSAVSACTQGIVPSFESTRVPGGTGSDPVRRPRGSTDARVRRKSCGASLSLPARWAASRTTSQMTFGVMPSPQTLPILLIARKTRPPAMPADDVQRSTVTLTQEGIGTVRM
jgi:hypothetical protein